MGKQGDAFNAALGRQIHAELTGAGYNKQSFASHSGVNYKTLNRYIDGERPIPAPAVYEIAAALDLTPQELFERAQDRLARESSNVIRFPHALPTEDEAYEQDAVAKTGVKEVHEFEDADNEDG